MSRYQKLHAQPILDGVELEEPVTDRQEKVAGFDQAAAQNSGIFACGAGGLFAEQGPDLLRKGYGLIACADPDVFSPSNYPRQFCYAKDLYENKAMAVGDNLVQEAILGADILSFALPYQDARHYVDWDAYDVGLCNVDNDSTRVDFSIDFRVMGKPALFCGVSRDANHGYVFIQESRPETPCFGCAFPEAVGQQRTPCPGTPACRDILKVLGGLTCYAVDSIVGERPRNWNLRWVFLAGFAEDAHRIVEKNPDCPLCGGTGN